jgi:hypothetical protein
MASLVLYYTELFVKLCGAEDAIKVTMIVNQE